MKKNTANEKPKKKITKKRIFSSAPNLPFREPRVKATDMFLVAPEEIRKYKRELLAANVADDKMKKGKHIKKTQTKQVNDKNVDKILLEPFKATSQTKKASEDYQYLVKKNIVKLMGATKKKAVNETEPKTKRAGSNVKKKKSEAGKKGKEQTKNLGKAEDQVYMTKRKNSTRKDQAKDFEMKGFRVTTRANTADLPRRNEVVSRQRAQTSPVIHRADYFTQPQGKTAMILHPTASTKQEGVKKFKMNKLREVFNVFKSKESEKGELQEIRKKLEDMERKRVEVAKKKKPVDKLIKPKPVDSANRLQKRKNKKNTQLDSASPSNIIHVNVKASPKVDETLPGNKPVQKKKKKLSAQNQVQTVSA